MRNIKNVNVVNFADLNVYEVFFGRNIVIDATIFKAEKAEKKVVAKKVVIKKGSK